MSEHRGERSGGTIRVRGTVNGSRVDVYHAACDETGCKATGPASPNSQVGARLEALKLGWQCEKVRKRGGLMETYVWRVRCPTHRSTPLASA